MREAQGEPAPSQRIDKWLFFARIVKSRSLAAKMVQLGRVRVNRDKISNAARAIRPGDVLTVSLERRVVVLKVLAAGDRRGPYSEARLLYEDLSPPEPPPEAAPPPVNAGVREQGSGRPTKKQRRKLDNWRGGE
ncbi:MAG: RNA-binding S4 domain-containing protein [Notoacmeibacter sp.]|nr:RNA-binding S4 domain-containing protein [Notoacmeibacter sp.]